MTDESLFVAALALPPAERSAYLDAHCPDPAQRQEIEALLAAHNASNLLDHPPLAATTAHQAPSSGRIGPYKLLQEIGEGGMGVVWMAEQTEPVRRRVALKLIKPGMDSRQVLARFEAERQALALMDHPNIARVLDAGTTDDGRPYFVMELVHGVPITQFCQDNRLDTRARLELFVQVCRAIQHAHQKGVIHRDIKPSNVLVCRYDDRPVPKVIDFGVAKALEQSLTDRTMFTGFGAVVGTLEYMSPEQAVMNQIGIDTRSDVYSLGVLLYELLTGTTPLERSRLRTEALDRVLRLIREEEAIPPSTRLSSSSATPAAEVRRAALAIRGELDWITLRALAKERERRYETANALARDVERHLVGEPVEACPPTWRYRLGKVWKRHRTAIVAVSLVTLLLVTATLSSLLFAFEASRQRNETSRLLGELQTERRDRALAEGIEAALSGQAGRAEQAIQRARDVGASEGRVAMLNGLLHYQRGESRLALQHLERAAELEPDSAAVQALLMLALQDDGQWARVGSAWQQLKERKASAPEDYLFLGAVQRTTVGDEDSLSNLDKAIERSMLMGYGYRGYRLAWRALDRGDPAMMQRALKDIDTAKALFRGNSFIELCALKVHLAAAGLYRSQANADAEAAMWDLAGQDVRSLEVTGMGRGGAAFSSIYTMHRFGPREMGAFSDRIRLLDGGSYGLGQAMARYMTNREKEASQILRENPTPDRTTEVLFQVLATAEDPAGGPENAYRIWQQANARLEASASDTRIMFVLQLLLLGKREEVPDQARRLLSVHPNQSPGIIKCVQYMTDLANGAGPEDEEGLTAWARGSAGKTSFAHYLIGLERLSRGDRQGARAAFRAAESTGCFHLQTCNLSHTLRLRLDADPKWPRWIPLATQEKP